jgi:hypothetical protein
MFEVLTNPSTLLCLGVVFLLISVLFFYFKRNISLLERAQMEQARILQSFITNMEMSQHMSQQMSRHLPSHMPQNIHSIDMNNHHSVPNQQSLIDVSDAGDSDEGDSDEGDSDDEDSDEDSDGSDDGSDGSDGSDDGSDAVSNDAVITGNNVSNGLYIINLSQENNDIKIVHLQDNNLEEFHPEILEINALHNSDKDDEDDEDNDDDSLDDSSIDDNSSHSLSEEEQQIVEEVKKEKIPLADFKTLSVQTLRQIAEDGELIKKGEKRTKKDLLSLLENTKK